MEETLRRYSTQEHKRKGVLVIHPLMHVFGAGLGWRCYNGPSTNFSTCCICLRLAVEEVPCPTLCSA
jgi:hypothetical protein